MAKEHNTKEDIVAYYDATQFDYKVVWYGKHIPSLHFGFYDKEKADNHFAALSNTNAYLAEQARIGDGDKVLDAGCGLGGSTIWLAQHFDADITGINITQGQVDQANKTIKDMEFKGKARFIQADYTQTPFEDQTFDVIWACESVCHAKHKIDFYKEAYRIMKPGGRIVLAEYLRLKRPLGTEDEVLLKNKWLNQWAIDDIDTEQEHYSNMEKAGFQNIRIDNVNDKVGASLRVLHEKTTRSYPIEWLLKTLGFRSKVAHGNLVGSINQYKAFKKGIWFYSVITGEK